MLLLGDKPELFKRRYRKGRVGHGFAKDCSRLIVNRGADCFGVADVNKFSIDAKLWDDIVELRI